MKKSIILLLFGVVLLSDKKLSAQTTISSMFNSQNYWNPNTPPFTGTFGGVSGTYWSNVKNSGVKFMRVGGNAFDASPGGTGTHVWTPSELANGANSIITEIRSYGIEPIIQVPIDITKTVAWNATNAASIVNTVNNTYSRNIIYWEIGNEPNNFYSGTYSTDAGIADYIKQVSTAMKGVTGQSGIKIIGPSLSFYDYTRFGNYFGGGADDITGTGTNGYYIDYIDFHAYPFGSGANLSGKTRTDVISDIATASSGHFKYDLGNLITKIGASSRTTSNLPISITEANISYQQDVTSSATRGILGIGPGSFLGGQYWAEMMCAAMEKGVSLLSFWSVIEGQSADTYLTDCGYICFETSATSPSRPTYWHYQMVANNFKGNYYPDKYSSPTANFKAFAYNNASANEMGVLIMNQTIQSPRGTDVSTTSFGIKFDDTDPANGTVKFRFAAGGGVIGEYDCTITNETTLFLAWDITTGALKKRQVYSLQDALRTTDTGTSETIANITDYTNYTNDMFDSDIIIGTGSSITATGAQTFKATNSIQLNGPYTSGSNALTLLIDTTCY